MYAPTFPKNQSGTWSRFNNICISTLDVLVFIFGFGPFSAGLPTGNWLI
jgi:hypothetical protein